MGFIRSAGIWRLAQDCYKLFIIDAFLDFSSLFYTEMAVYIKIHFFSAQQKYKILAFILQTRNPSTLLIYTFSITFWLGICLCVSSTALHREIKSFCDFVLKYSTYFYRNLYRGFDLHKTLSFLLHANIYRHWYICFYIQLVLISHDVVFCGISWNSELVNNGS